MRALVCSCFNFRDTGRCVFGDECKYAHIVAPAQMKPASTEPCHLWARTGACKWGSTCKVSLQNNLVSLAARRGACSHFIPSLGLVACSLSTSINLVVTIAPRRTIVLPPTTTIATASAIAMLVLPFLLATWHPWRWAMEELETRTRMRAAILLWVQGEWVRAER